LLKNPALIASTPFFGRVAGMLIYEAVSPILETIHLVVNISSRATFKPGKFNAACEASLNPGVVARNNETAKM
jgi:hypothetical protein